MERVLRFQRIAAFDRFSSAALVQINTLGTSLNASGHLVIQLDTSEAGISCEMVAIEPRTVRYVDEQNFYYYGQPVKTDSCGCEGLDGDFMLESVGGRRYGFFTLDDNRFEVIALDSLYSVLARIDDDYFADKQECVPGELSEGLSPNPDAGYRNPGCRIRVLFLFTQAAEDAFGLEGLSDMTSLGISQTNQAFANSAIDNVCIARANIREWEGFVENQDNLLGDVGQLINSNQVALWRQEDLADVVCLITDARYQNGRQLGLSGILPDPTTPGSVITNLGNPMENLAYMIVEGYSFNSNFTFSHELGHVLGCRHQTCATFFRDGCDDGGGEEHGHGWGERPCLKWKNYSTILHQLRHKNTRLLRYSNPGVEHNGHPTGVIDISDNAAWIRGGNGCTVADYRPEPFMPLEAVISGEVKLCRPGTGEYQASVSGTGAPYSYEWHISTNGVDWGTSAGTGPSLMLNSQAYPSNTLVFLRLRVDNTLGNAVFAFFSVMILPQDATECYQFEPAAAIGQQSPHVFPNPANDRMRVSFTVEAEDTPVSFGLYTTTGVLVSRTDKRFGAGEHQEEVSLFKAPVGQLFLRVQIGDKIYPQRLLKH